MEESDGHRCGAKAARAHCRRRPRYLELICAPGKYPWPAGLGTRIGPAGKGRAKPLPRRNRRRWRSRWSRAIVDGDVVASAVISGKAGSTRTETFGPHAVQAGRISINSQHSGPNAMLYCRGFDPHHIQHDCRTYGKQSRSNVCIQGIGVPSICLQAAGCGQISKA